MKAQHLQVIKSESNSATLHTFAADRGVHTAFWINTYGAHWVRLEWVSDLKLWRCANDCLGRSFTFDQDRFDVLVAKGQIQYFGEKHSDEQRKAFHAEGRSRYGSDWNTKRAELCKAITCGITASSKELTSIDMERLMSGMRKQKPQYKNAA